MNITKALNDQIDFSISEKEIANYILKNKDKLLTMSVQDLAATTFTSTSAVVRLCRKIQLTGFKEFKIKYSAELQQKTDSYDHIDPDCPFNEDDTIREIAAKMVNLSKESIDETFQLLSDSNMLIEKAADIISNSNRTGMFCIGDSFLRALAFQNRMAKINRTINIPTIPGEQVSMAYYFTNKDCAIILTYSGETEEVYQSARWLRRNRVPIITITSNPNSRIGKLSTVVLTIPNKESNIRFGTFSSQLSIEYYLNTLYSYFFVLDFHRNKKFKAELDIRV